MNFLTKTGLVLSLSFFLMVAALAGVKDAGAAGFVGTQTCINCHNTWPDNGPSTADVAVSDVSDDYYPFNLYGTRGAYPFYTIPEAYIGSIHNVTAFNLVDNDRVTCEGCHGSGIAHYGIGQIPAPIPQAKNCGTCHQPPYFEIEEFMATGHANKAKDPGKYFDQPRNGTKQAIQIRSTGPVALYQRGTFGPVGDPVSRNMRIQECSVCHSYALNYDQFAQLIVQGNMPNPQVSCGACHDSHIVAPNGRDSVVVNNTVKVTAAYVTPTSTTVLAATPVQGRSTYPLYHKPYKVLESGAQSKSGDWSRGSAYSRPGTVIAQGAGTLATNGTTTLTVTGGGLSEKVKPMNTVLLSGGEATGTANLPADAVDAGKPVTVKATLTGAGFEVEEVEGGDILVLAQKPTVTVGVTYKKSTTGTGTLNVPVTFSGSVTFEVRDMYTNTETLCASCHTKGKYRHTAWGKQADGTYIDRSNTHNSNVYGQYLKSGHAKRTDPAWAEFSAWEFGSSHQVTYPFDMSITGTGGVNSLRNGGFSTYTLTQTPNVQNAYLVTAGNTTQVPIISNYACNQCHHGLGSIDYQFDRQGTSEASVLWGDATVTCITCHDPHAEGAGTNIRIPVKLSYNTYFVDATKNPKGGINKMMDGTDIPSGAGLGIICLFCHQGRESGLTVYKNISGRGVNPYTEPNKVISASGISFQNPHYLDSGAVLWSKNAWEYYFNMVPQTYSNGIPQHQETNCTDCHMGRATTGDLEGGHTWKPKLAVCQECHGPIPDFFSVPASGDYDGNGTVQTAAAEIGTVSPPTGLIGQLVLALEAKGIYYNPDSYPYFFDASGGQFRAWTTNTLTAAFNLSYNWKAMNAMYVHNAWYTAQILQDSLRALGVNITNSYYRPAGQRNATYYPDIVINP